MALFIPIISLHSYSYRPREEIKEVRETRDPITMFKRRITDCNLVTPEELKVKGQRLSSKFFDNAINSFGAELPKIAYYYSAKQV